MPPPRNDRLPLTALLDGGLDDATPVAFGRGVVRSRGDLRRSVAALAAAVAQHHAGRWLLCTDDSYAAAVGLLALARCRATAVLPPNQQPETLRRLAEGCVGALWATSGRAGAEAAEFGDRVIDPLCPPAAPPCTAPTRLDREAPMAEFHTSGTTGGGRAVAKRLRHLEDEVLALEARLGAALPAHARIFASASHQHIYGLLFRVLWPLASGRPFQAEALLHARELLPRLAECDAAVLVTTPVHLKRLAGTERLRPLRGICRAVFSSGGPLDAETAQSVAEQLGAAPIEVFGSTETGGVATRRRDADGEGWVPMPGVDVQRCRADGRLQVTSPYVSVGEQLTNGRCRTVMGDRAEIAGDGSFRLLGRVDRVVKVGEKRLALPEMERALESHAHVAEAALLVREQGGQGRVHAVVAPSERGKAALRREGRRGFGAELTCHLSGSFDPVVLPRAWRTVEALPRDAQDKLPVAALSALFADSSDLSGSSEGLRVLDERRADDTFEWTLAVSQALPQLEGHFEGFPVVAGVVQLGWVVDAAAAWLGWRPTLRGLEALKFPRPLRPDRTLALRIERSPDGRKLRFRLSDGADIFASGRLLVERGAA